MITDLDDTAFIECNSISIVSRSPPQLKSRLTRYCRYNKSYNLIQHKLNMITKDETIPKEYRNSLSILLNDINSFNISLCSTIRSSVDLIHRNQRLGSSVYLLNSSNVESSKEKVICSIKQYYSFYIENIKNITCSRNKSELHKFYRETISLFHMMVESICFMSTFVKIYNNIKECRHINNNMIRFELMSYLIIVDMIDNNVSSDISDYTKHINKLIL